MKTTSEELRKLGENRSKFLELANLANLLGHPMRLEIVECVRRSNGATWTEISKRLQETHGVVNPNTISFHLSKLIVGGMVEKKKDETYVLSNNAQQDKVLTVLLSRLEVE